MNNGGKWVSYDIVKGPSKLGNDTDSRPEELASLSLYCRWASLHLALPFSSASHLWCQSISWHLEVHFEGKKYMVANENVQFKSLVCHGNNWSRLDWGWIIPCTSPSLSIAFSDLKVFSEFFAILPDSKIQKWKTVSPVWDGQGI